MYVLTTNHSQKPEPQKQDERPRQDSQGLRAFCVAYYISRKPVLIPTGRRRGDDT